MSPVNVALVANWHDTPQLENCIKSIAYHNDNVNYYVVNSDISQEWFFHLNSLLKQFHSKIFDQKVNSDSLNSHDNYPAIMEAKLLLPHLLPQVNRVLFCDLGVIVNTPLNNLFSLDLNGAPLAALLTHNQQQFDSRLLLLDLQQLRKNYSADDLRKAWESHSLANGDQDLFNDLFGDQQMNFSESLITSSANGQHVLEILQKPWQEDLNHDNQLWWQFFATDWPLIQQHQNLVAVDTLTKPSPHSTDESQKRMKFILVANYGYQNVFMAGLKSLLYYNQNIDIYFVNPDIPTTWFNAINNLIGPHNHLIDVKISWDKLAMGNVQEKLGHVNNMTNALLFLHELIPVPRAIYLDSDVIVNRNLRPFYDLDLQDHPFASVREMLDLDIINVGVMLLDLDKLREDKSLTDRMVNYYQTHDVPYASESVLTDFFYDKYLDLNYRYDYQVGRESAHAAGYDFNEMDRNLPDVFCVHYVTGDKPWNLLSFVRHRQLWWAANDLSWNDIQHHLPLAKSTRFTSPYRVMICTGDQNIEHLDELVRACPNVEFNITAHTVVAWNLIQITRYPNVHVYQLVIPETHQRLSDISNLILDIGYGSKDADLARTNLDHNKFVLTFNSTQNQEFHDSPNYLIFADDDVQGFIDTMRKFIYYGDPMN